MRAVLGWISGSGLTSFFEEMRSIAKLNSRLQNSYCEYSDKISCSRMLRIAIFAVQPTSPKPKRRLILTIECCLSIHRTGFK